MPWGKTRPKRQLKEQEGEELREKTLLNFAIKKYFNVPLTTHYRSKSKKLIEFSNDNFYKVAGINLDAVDSPLSRFDGKNSIIVEEVKGIWKEEKVYDNEIGITLEKRTNLKEAKLVVELFDQYYNANKSLSIGIITFNDPQKKLIYDLLIKKFQENAEILKFLDNPAKFFIKAIKNVQGDERDIIIFSITYGLREKSHKYVKGYGQFSKEKINVAITRARLRIHILKSLPSNEITANNEHYQIFKKWLHYLETNVKKDDIILEHENKYLSIFQKDFCDLLLQSLNDRYQNNKYQLLTNYPVGNKEIDLVVWNKQSKSFVCAVELDGLKQCNRKEESENNYNWEILLENMGWKFIRLSALNFYSDKKQTVEWVLSKMTKIENKRY